MQALDGNLALFQQIISENNAAILLIVQSNGTISGASRGACNFYGYPLSELITMSIYDINTMSKAEVAAKMDRAMEGKERHCKCHHRLASGEVRYVESYFTPIQVDGNTLFYTIIHDITEFNHVQEELRESDERFSLFMDYLPAIVFIKDEKSRTLYVNKYMNDVLGAKDWIGKSPLELFSKKIGQAMIADDKNTQAKGYQKIVETVPDKYGTNHIYQTHKFSIKRSGKPPLLGGIALDITESTQAHLERKQYIHDMGERVKELKCLYGITESFRTGNSLDEIFHDVLKIIPPGWHYPEYTKARICFDCEEFIEAPFELTEWKQSSDLMIDDKCRGAIEIYYTKEFPPLDEGPFLKEERHLIDGISKTLSEFVEHKQAENELYKAMVYQKAILAAIPDLMFELDEEGRYLNLWANNPGELPCFEDKMLGRTVSEVLPANAADRVMAALREADEKGQSHGHTIQLTTPNGELWFELSTSLKDGNASPRRFIMLSRNITERKNSELEQKLLETELQQAQKMESLGLLTGGIAHDFNNLLGIINGYADLAQEKLINQDDDKLVEYVRNIKHAGVQAAKLVAQMLSFSRGDDAEDISIQFGPLIKDEINMLQSTLPSTIEIKSRIDLNLPDVLMNPTQLHQILMNLSINARDAMNGIGELTITLGMAHDTDTVSTVSHKPIKGDWIELCISDTGSGIDSETAMNIFNPFFTTKEEGKGTGLGLSVIYRIMENHGGHILLESKLGKGSTFRMLFPPIVGDSINLSGLEQEHVEIPEGDGSEILVVDDVPMLALHMSELVKEHGYEAFMVTDSTEALEIFREDPDRFSMLITDQTMPKMTGAELISELREIRPELPVIMCSGYSDKIDLRKASELNIFYISKPVDVRKLLLKIPDLLSENSSDAYE